MCVDFYNEVPLEKILLMMTWLQLRTLQETQIVRRVSMTIDKAICIWWLDLETTRARKDPAVQAEPHNQEKVAQTKSGRLSKNWLWIRFKAIRPKNF